MDSATPSAADSVEGAFLLWEQTQRQLDAAEQGLLKAREEGDADATARLTAEVASLRQKAEELLGAARNTLHTK